MTFKELKEFTGTMYWKRVYFPDGSSRPFRDTQEFERCVEIMNVLGPTASHVEILTMLGETHVSWEDWLSTVKG